MYKLLATALLFNLTGFSMGSEVSNSPKTDLQDLLKLSFKELTEVKIVSDIASNNLRPIIEQPSIISVVNRNQIINSGARDLLDIMRMIPGFGFAHDTAGINSWGFRGVWGHEGKIMLLVDGAPQNDPAWGNLQFGRHYPAEIISKVEVIRGPGAAKFGNYAELAVVRVTTLGQELNGGFVDVNLRQMEDEFSSAELTASYGKKSDNGIGYSFYLHRKDSIRTTSPFLSSDHSISIDQDNSPMETFVIDSKLHYSDLTFKFLYEDYSFEHQEALGMQLPDPNNILDQYYERHHIGIDYENEINSSITLNANFLYQDVMSHDMSIKQSLNNEFNLGSHYLIETDRFIYNTDILYKISDNSNINFGIEFFKVEAVSKAIGEYFVDANHQLPGDSTEMTDTWYDGNNRFNFHQSSVFIQYENYNDVLNFTIGGRYANHSESTKSVFVPRIGLSKLWCKANV